MSNAEVVGMWSRNCAQRQKDDARIWAAYEKKVAAAKKAKENKRMEFYKSILEMGLSILSFVGFAVMMAILQ